MRRCLAFVVAAAAVFAYLRVAAWLHGHPAEALYDGDRAAQEALARGVTRSIEVSPEDFATGGSRFDGEWALVTRVMAVLGFAQTALEHPELRAPHAVSIERCLVGLLDAEARAFDREAWGTDAFADLGSERAHAGYLGYVGLALAMARVVDPQTPHAAIEAQVVEHLAQRLEASPIDLVETYPGEIYPADNSAAFAAIALHDYATGEDHRALLQRLVRGLERHRDPHTGLLHQVRGGEARGSGTALAAYFLSFADARASRSLYRAMRAQLVHRTLGFGTTAEYASGWGMGDVDSGPVILGQSVSATGFTIGAARAHADRDVFVGHYTTAAFFGGPVDRDGGTQHALGGPLGDALLFALLTAQPAERWAR